MNSEEARLLDRRTEGGAAEHRLELALLWATVALGLAGGLAGMRLLICSIVRRTQTLEDNAGRLAQAGELAELPAGNDEIGRLAKALGRASRLLVAREAELDESRAFLESLLETSPGGIAKLRLDDVTVTYASPGLERLWGYTNEEAVRVPGFWVQRIHPDDRDKVMAEMECVRAEGSSETEFVYRLRRKTGDYRWLSSSVRFQRDDAGEFTEAISYTLDVEERKASEEAVRAAREEADRANRAKSEFLSRTSHELRTPLNAILGFAQLLELGELEADQKESVDHIMSGGRHLLELINEVLDIARIEAGRLAVSLEPVLLDELLHESIELIEPLANARDITVHGPAPLSCDRYVRADRQRLKQVLLNLLGNAVKYNHDGGSVSVTCEDRSDGMETIAVRDTGPGIAPDKLQDLFTPFHRLSAEATGVEGTSLGLALSRQLAEVMGGSVGAESVVGEGSTFYLDLAAVDDPMERVVSVEEKPSPAVPANPGRRTLLYVEDNSSNLRLVQYILARRPETTLLAATAGATGLEMAVKHVPDLILLDINLPDIEGAEVLARLKADPLTASIPVVMLSADATQGQIDRLLADGAVAYLTKPLDVRDFLETIDACLTGGVASTRPGS
jgi:PAS domain S-box-containing protein